MFGIKMTIESANTMGSVSWCRQRPSGLLLLELRECG